MKNYTTPEMEIIALSAEDIITTSEPSMSVVVETPYDSFEE